MKIKVKLNSKIAARGGGFYDIESKQNIYPTRKNGEIDIEEVFDVEATQFVESKIASGELILISRCEVKNVAFEVFVGTKKLTEINVPEGSSDDEVYSQLAKNKEYQEMLKNHEVTGYSIERNKMTIKVK